MRKPGLNWKPRKLDRSDWIPHRRNSTIRRIKRRLENGHYKNSADELNARNLLYKFSLEKRPTQAELLFGDYLQSIKVDFLFQKGFLRPFHRIYDFYIPGRKIAFEIDGSSHDGKEAKDARKDRWYLDERGIRTFRITNREVFNREHEVIVREVL